MTNTTPAHALVAKIKAQPCLQCATTGDLVASRVDRHNTHSGWKTSVLYWYVPVNAASEADLVPLNLPDLAGAFFTNSIDPFTGRVIESPPARP